MKFQRLLSVLAAAVLTACGGGGSDGGASGGGGGFGPSSGSAQYAQQCGPSNPFRLDGGVPIALGSLSTEKSWIRAYFDEAYLWRDEVPTVNPADPRFSDESALNYEASINNYFNALRTPALTASGARKDRFSFTYPTKDWRLLSQSGVSWSHGVQWRIGSPTPPRQIRVVDVEPNSPAALQGLRRGDTLVAVDGVSADGTSQAEVDKLNAALFPSSASANVFTMSRGGVLQAPVQVVAGQISSTPVPTVSTVSTPTGLVGYLVFNDHILTAENALINAMSQFRNQGVTDLVLDLRYNGGGYLFLASELAYMVAGSTRTNGRTFEKLTYNSRRTQDNAQAPTPFYSTACLPNSNFQCTTSAPLPALNLTRVYVITTSQTCSASEAIINGLEGVGVQVLRIGSTTCGKPYGFTAKDNCGISYFPIEFKGVNDAGFGDYADGFTARCAVTDDLSRPLGDPQEGMLAAALTLRATGNCPPAGAGAASRAVAGAAPETEGRLVRNPLRENRWLGGRP